MQLLFLGSPKLWMFVHFLTENATRNCLPNPHQSVQDGAWIGSHLAFFEFCFI